MHKPLIVALLAVNVALVAALVVVNQPRAEGQVVGGGKDYLLMTGSDGTSDAVYVLELNSQRLRAWRFDKTRKRLEAYGGVDLGRESQRGQALAPPAPGDEGRQAQAAGTPRTLSAASQGHRHGF